MLAPDFLRSFLTFSSDATKKQSQTQSHQAPYTFNAARTSVDAVCTIDDVPYVLGAACKTEIVGPHSDLWLQPNADFCITASAEEYLIMKSWINNQIEVMLHPADLGRQPERQAGRIDETFTDLVIHLHQVEADELLGAAAIIEATYAHRPLIARLEYAESGHQIRIDHPVKTMNVNPRDNVFQTDTGPVILPDFARRQERDLAVGRFELAFEAFNQPDWAEFLLRRPTPVSDDSTVTANHYAVTRRIEGMRNHILALA